MRSVVNVVIAPMSDEYIEVRWDRRMNTQVSREFVDEVDDLDGVEAVVAEKYRATVRIAPHVRRLHDIMAELREVLTGEEHDFLRSPAVRLGGLVFEVTVLPVPPVKV